MSQPTLRVLAAVGLLLAVAFIIGTPLFILGSVR